VRRALPTIAALLAAAILQAGLAPYLSIGQVVPNFLLLVVITIALVEGPGPGAAVGFSAGLIFELLGSGPVGPMLLVLTLTGFLTGLMHENMFAEGWLLPLTVLAIATLSAEVAYGAILILLGADVPFWSTLLTRMIPGAVYNTALALLIYPLLARFLRQERAITTFERLG
jgi:rod shape-determining protein MreD